MSSIPHFLRRAPGARSRALSLPSPGLDRRFWSWLAINHAQPYIRARHGKANGAVTAWRYTGELLRNGLSLLWWGAELSRNGPDYADVPLVFRNVRTAQFALELKYSWFRPATIAFARVAAERKLEDGGRSLSKRINALLPTHVVESMALQASVSDARDAGWYGQRASFEQLRGKLDVVVGPEEGFADETAVRTLEDWFTGLAARAE